MDEFGRVLVGPLLEGMAGGACGSYLVRQPDPLYQVLCPFEWGL